tara:strand:+ start:1686 stop:2591 length:906 start_codon:yes stop_codon:yes gene_type:complete
MAKIDSSQRAASMDKVWIWAGPGNSLGPSIYGLSDTASYFGSENVCAMWLPSTTPPSATLETLDGFRQVVWDLTCTRWQRKPYRLDDDEETVRIGFFEENSWGQDRGHESKEEAERISALSNTYSNIAGGILDYSFGGFTSRGGTPELLKQIQDALRKENPELKLHWMNFTTDVDEKWVQYLPYVDVISLWEPSPEKLASLEESVERCGDVFQGKPIVVGVFLAHYWARNMKLGETDRLQHHREWALRPMSHDILQAQLETSARLLEEGKIAGVSILAEALVDKFPDTAAWIRDILKANFT